MGQKVNPHGLRVGIIKDWDSRWYAEGNFADNLVEDDKIRKYVKEKIIQCRNLQNRNRESFRQSKIDRLYSKTWSSDRKRRICH